MSQDPDPAFREVPKSRPWPGASLSGEDLITLNEEIAGMARAGLPLDQGLAALAHEMGTGRLQEVTSTLAADLHAGLSLPEAIAKQKGRVPPYYAALLAAGIRTGRIGDVLGTVTLYARSIAEFRENVVSALLYPMVVLLLGTSLLGFVGYFILPTYVTVFRDFRMKLPPLTQMLVFVGEHPIEILVLPPVFLVLGLFLTWLALSFSIQGRILWTRFIYALPVAGSLIQSARLAAFTDLLGLLVDQSVPLPEALRLAGDASSDLLLAEGSKRIESRLLEGVPLGRALRQQRLVPDLVVWMIAFGEKQGTLGPALHQVAQLYRRQAEVRAAFLRTVLPPLLILVLAAVLGGLFIFGLMAPFHALLDGLSGGGKR